MKKMTGTMFVLMVLAFRPLFSQPAVEEQPRKPYSSGCFYLELLGTGLLYSINYEHRFAENWSGRAGFTRFSIPTIFEPELDLSVTGFPVLLNYLAGSDGHYFEMGAGVLILRLSLTGRELWLGMNVNGHVNRVIGAAAIGYRYQPSKGGFLFRIGVTPLFHPGGVKISGGLSVGAAF
jgi:hypothetical protein